MLRRMRGFRRALAACGRTGTLVAAALVSCSDGQLPSPASDVLELPTGARLGPSGQRLLVVNSNLDREFASGALVSIDLEALEQGMQQPLEEDATRSAARPCRRSAMVSGRLECEATWLIEDERTLRLPTGAGNIAADRPAGEDGPLRLLIPSSFAQTVTWIDVLPDPSGGLRFRCGQDGDGVCDDVHTLRYDDGGARLPADPARLVVDDQGFRFAYLPHLIGGVMTLIALDGGVGPEIVDIQGEFFLEDPFAETGLAGGFSVAQRACDPTNPPSDNQDCSKPSLYASHRHWPGMRQFSVAVGLDLILAQGDVPLAAANPFGVLDRPFMGELEFEDPALGERLLAVHTTPPSLSRIDTSIDDEGAPRNETREVASLCHYPNLVEVYRPEGREWLAFVSCYSEGQVAVVGLSAFSVIATIATGEGANELVVDAARQRLYVVNTLESSIALVELDHLSPRFLEVVAVVGG